MNISEIKNLISKNKFAEAREHLEKYTEENSSDTDALNLLSLIYFQLGDFAKAVRTLERVAEINSNSAAPLINLGIIYYQKDEHAKALEYLRRAVEIEKDNYLARYNYALALAEIGETDEAIKNYSAAIELKPDYYDAYYNLSMLYLMKGNYEKGWEYYEYRFKCNELKRKELAGTRWHGETAKEKTLYVYSDQGFGDAIQFVRLLEEAKKRVKEVILETQIELLGLMKSLPYVDRVVPVRPDFSPVAKYDLQIPLMSLPYALKINDENIPDETPYLQADREKKTKWKALLESGKKIKIGIAWRGNPVYRKNHIRSTDVKYFKEIFKLPRTIFFSLQKDIYEREREFLLANEVVDMSEHLRDFSETAAIIDNLDLIITTDTVIPHLAGAFGKPVYTLLAKVPDWRWGISGETTPWYPTMKLFRQNERGDWKSAFDKALAETKKFIDAR